MTPLDNPVPPTKSKSDWRPVAPIEHSSTRLRFSLIATVYNDVEGTRKFVQRMEEQSRKPDEIVILDAGSKDGTWEALKEYERNGSIPMKLLRRERCKPAGSRNLCAREASYDLLAVTDIGCDWDALWFEELVAPIEADPSLDAVMGSWRVLWEDQKTEWAKADYFLQPTIQFRATSKSLAANRAIVYKRAFYLELGGLPEDLTFAGDDLLLALQIQSSGAKIGAAPIPRCSWERPQTLPALIKESRRYGRGNAEIGLWVRDFSLVSARLLFEILMLTLALLLTILHKYLAAVVCLGVLLLLVCSRSIKLWRRRHLRATSGQTVSFWRILVLEYATKFSSLVGCLEGFRHGKKHCCESRRKAREVANP
jgi:cellulose synthase/poly-beta-1,6-N-acetylglucosamine synthase-like glycosyltransferase